MTGGVSDMELQRMRTSLWLKMPSARNSKNGKHLKLQAHLLHSTSLPIRKKDIPLFKRVHGRYRIPKKTTVLVDTQKSSTQLAHLLHVHSRPKSSYSTQMDYTAEMLHSYRKSQRWQLTCLVKASTCSAAVVFNLSISDKRLDFSPSSVLTENIRTITKMRNEVPFKTEVWLCLSIQHNLHMFLNCDLLFLFLQKQLICFIESATKH